MYGVNFITVTIVTIVFKIYGVCYYGDVYLIMFCDTSFNATSVLYYVITLLIVNVY